MDPDGQEWLRGVHEARCGNLHLMGEGFGICHPGPNQRNKTRDPDVTLNIAIDGPGCCALEENPKRPCQLCETEPEQYQCPNQATEDQDTIQAGRETTGENKHIL